MSITSNNPIAFTCFVCGKPTGVLAPPLPMGSAANLCTACNQTVCAKHYSRSRKICVRCAQQTDGWCRTPGGKI